MSRKSQTIINVFQRNPCAKYSCINIHLTISTRMTSIRDKSCCKLLSLISFVLLTCVSSGALGLTIMTVLPEKVWDTCSFSPLLCGFGIGSACLAVVFMLVMGCVYLDSRCKNDPNPYMTVV
jgi:hypothetical protein